MNKELLILGLDPGITTAYALLNLKGEIIRLKSSKRLTLSTIVKEVFPEGKILVVGTDVKYPPEYIKKFARICNAKLVHPSEDMKVGLKVRMTSQLKPHDAHQRDALAAALNAWREMQPLFSKVDMHLKGEGKEHLTEVVKELVVTRGVNIADALLLLEKKETEVKPKKRVREKIKRSQRFFFEKELLEQRNLELLEEVKRLQRKIEEKERNVHAFAKKMASEMLHAKEKTIILLNKQLENREKDLTMLRDALEEMNYLMTEVNDKMVVKRFKSLSWNDDLLDVKKNEFVFVDDPCTFSEKALAVLREKGAKILTNGNSPQSRALQDFQWVNMQGWEIIKKERYVLVKREDVENVKEDDALLSRIIDEYKEERRSSEAL